MTVAIVNDYELIVQGLAAILAPYSDRVAVVDLEVGGAPSRVADVALFDTFASRRDSLARAREMVDDDVVGHVVLYTWDASTEYLRLAREAGVAGVVFKSQTGDGLVDAIERVVRGEEVGFDRGRRGRVGAHGVALTDREQEVLALIAIGSANKEIAEELFLSVDTVKSHVRRLYAKLGVHNRTQAAMSAAGHHLPPPARRLVAGR